MPTMGIIRNLIRKTEQSRLPVGMVDLHCHILPGFDDGADSMEESIAMARIAAGDGIMDIIATPHLNNCLYDFSRVVTGARYLNRVLAGLGIPLHVHPGAEVSVIFEPAQLSGFTLNNGCWLLLEFCHVRLPANADELLGRYLEAGFKVIIAHPERNPSVMADPGVLCSLLRHNVFVQLTAASLTGDFGSEVQRCALHLLRNNFVDFLASDAHSKSYRRPVLSRAFRVAEKYIGYTEAAKLVRDNPRTVLAGCSPAEFGFGREARVVNGGKKG